MKQMEGLEKRLERSPSPKRIKVEKAEPQEQASPTKQLPSAKMCKTPVRAKASVPKLTEPELSPIFQKEIQRSSVTSQSNRSCKSLIKPPVAASKNRSVALNRERINSIFSDGRDGRSPKGSVETTTLSGDDDDTATDNDELMSESSHSRINCFNIDSMPAARLLSKSEKKMCENLRLTPSYYINVKGMIIKVSNFEKSDISLQLITSDLAGKVRTHSVPKAKNWVRLRRRSNQKKGQ